MQISYDPAKREWTLAERNLDFAEAIHVFEGPKYDVLDDRFDYGEIRWITYGLLRDRLVAVVWTDRGPNRQIISMRKCNDREQKKFQDRLA